MIPRQGSKPEAGELRTYLMGKLPDYMVPAAFIDLPFFAMTANGKIDRKALPAPSWTSLTKNSKYVAPRTLQEESFAKIWSDVLHLERVGVEDNIFELGGDSLHVFQIAARANQAGIEARPRQILQYRNIAAILADIEKSSGAPKQAPLIPVSRAKYRITQHQAVREPEPVDPGGHGN
jgi:hypothetical protein